MKTFLKGLTSLKSKSIVVMTAFLFVSISLFAQVDSTSVVNATNTGLSVAWTAFSGILSANVWSIVALVATILLAISEHLSFTKNKTVNGVIQAVLSFLSKKK